MNLKSLGKLHYVGIVLARVSLGVPGQIVYTVGALAFEYYVEKERRAYFARIESTLKSVKL